MITAPKASLSHKTGKPLACATSRTAGLALFDAFDAECTLNLMEEHLCLTIW